MKFAFLLFFFLPILCQATGPCPPNLSIGLQLKERYARLQMSSPEDKRVRFQKLRSLLEDVLSDVKARPINSGNSNRGEMSISLVAGGFSNLRCEDIADSNALAKITKRIRAADLPAEMWVAHAGESMPTQNYYGLTKLIVEYEHLLSGFADALERGQGKISAYVLDLMILKQQNYFDLAPELKMVLEDDFTPAGFNRGGIELPRHYPERSVVGSEIIFVATDISEKDTIVQSRESLRAFAEELQKILALRESSSPHSKLLLPTVNQTYTRWKTEDLRDLANKQQSLFRELLPAPGTYRGVIVRSDPAGFAFRAPDGRVYKVNVNFGLKLISILLRPQTVDL